MTAVAERAQSSSGALTALRTEVREFLAAQTAAGAFEPSCDSWLSGHDPEFSRSLALRGWLGMTWPQTYGGQGRTQLERYAVNEELLAAGAPVAAHWIGDRQVGPALLKNGTEEQRRRYLPAMARGELFFAIGMSEPDSGSDLASVRTMARPCDGGFRVSGTKVWTSHAQHAHQMLALVRTEPLGDRRHQGLSQLIVDLAAPGVQINPIDLIDGEAHFNEVVLDDVFVPQTNVLGVLGEGWKQVTSELAHERSGPERVLSTYPLLDTAICDHGGRDPMAVGELIARLVTLRSMSADVAKQLEAGRTPAVEAAIVKDLGTRFEGDSIDIARRLLNVEPDPTTTDKAGRLLAEAIQHAPVFTLRGGTNEVLRGIIARSVAPR